MLFAVLSFIFHPSPPIPQAVCLFFHMPVMLLKVVWFSLSPFFSISTLRQRHHPFRMSIICTWVMMWHPNLEPYADMKRTRQHWRRSLQLDFRAWPRRWPTTIPFWTNTFSIDIRECSLRCWIIIGELPFSTPSNPTQNESPPSNATHFPPHLCIFSVLFSPSWQNRQTSLPDRCLWASVRGGAGVLGPWLEPGGTVLLVNVQCASRHAG